MKLDIQWELWIRCKFIDKLQFVKMISEKVRGGNYV